MTLFRFFYFFFKTLGTKKKYNPNSGGNLQAGKFLKY
jgi:hypothetical protein